MIIYLYSGLQTLTVFLNAAAWLFIGIVVGPEFLGSSSYSLALVAVCTVLTGFGIESNGNYTDKYKKRRAGALLQIKIASSILAGLIVFIFLTVINSKNFLDSVGSALLVVQGVSLFIENRSIRAVGVKRILLISSVFNVVSAVIKILVATLTQSIAVTFISVVFIEIAKIIMLYEKNLYSFNIKKQKLKYYRMLLSHSNAYYSSDFLSVLYQKLIPIVSNILFGNKEAGLLVGHISLLDMYSSFCRNAAQFAYHDKKIRKTSRSLESTLRFPAIATWLLVILICVIILAIPYELSLGKIALNKYYLLMLMPMLIVHVYGPMFTHWYVINGYKNRLPYYHLSSLLGLASMLTIFVGIGPFGVILARTISSFSGHFLMTKFGKIDEDKTQWKVLLKCLIFPFWLEK